LNQTRVENNVQIRKIEKEIEKATKKGPNWANPGGTPAQQGCSRANPKPHSPFSFYFSFSEDRWDPPISFGFNLQPEAPRRMISPPTFPTLELQRLLRALPFKAPKLLFLLPSFPPIK
jgi:hypothetical protein